MWDQVVQLAGACAAALLTWVLARGGVEARFRRRTHELAELLSVVPDGTPGKGELARLVSARVQEVVRRESPSTAATTGVASERQGSLKAARGDHSVAQVLAGVLLLVSIVLTFATDLDVTWWAALVGGVAVGAILIGVEYAVPALRSSWSSNAKSG